MPSASLSYPGLYVYPSGGCMSLGPQIVDFMRTFLCHGPGDVQGLPYRPSEDAENFLAMAYALAESGRRIVKRAVYSRPKGYAKSELAGAVCIVEAVGPCRFSHFAKRGETSWWGYRYEKGEPVGRSIVAPFIRCLATEEDQSGNTYDNVPFMLEHGAIADVVSCDPGLTRTLFKPSGEIRPSTAAASSKDGGKETFRVADETHLYKLAYLKQMVRTVDRNLAKRHAADGWGLDTTTMYAKGEKSVAESVHKQAVDIAEGKTENRGLLFDHREGGEVKDWSNDRALRRAIVIAYAGAPHMDPDTVLASCREADAEETDSRRYFLNAAVDAADAYVSERDWAAAKIATPAPLLPGDPIALGFDGGESDDHTALVAERLTDRQLFRVGHWQPVLDVDDWRVPRAQVTAKVRELHAVYKVAYLFGDPPGWQTELDEWDAEHGTVVRFETYQAKKMALALERFTTDLKVGLLKHCDDADLTEHVLNAQRKTSQRGSYLAIAKPKANRKIDLCVGAVLCHAAACYAFAEGWEPEEDVDIAGQVY